MCVCVRVCVANKDDDERQNDLLKDSYCSMPSFKYLTKCLITSSNLLKKNDKVIQKY